MSRAPDSFDPDARDDASRESHASPRTASFHSCPEDDELRNQSQDGEEDYTCFPGSEGYLQFLAASAQEEDNDNDMTFSSDSSEPMFDIQSSWKRRRGSVSSSIHDSLQESTKHLGEKHRDISMLQSESDNDKENVTEQLRLPPGEHILDDYSAWFVRDVMLQGRLYTTDKALYFWASLPPSSSAIIKASNLRKKSSHTVRSHRYWFILQQNFFSYYNAPEDIYFPAGIIDLTRAINVRLEIHNDEPSSNFILSTRHKTYVFKADTPNDAHDWVKALQKEIFRIRNNGSHLRMRIPWRNIILEESREVVPRIDLMRLAVITNHQTLKLANYLFCFFRPSEEAIKQVGSMIQEYGSEAAAIIGPNEQMELDKSLLRVTENVEDTTCHPDSKYPDISMLFPAAMSQLQATGSVDSGNHDTAFTKEVIFSLMALTRALKSATMAAAREFNFDSDKSSRRSKSFTVPHFEGTSDPVSIAPSMSPSARSSAASSHTAVPTTDSNVYPKADDSRHGSAPASGNATAVPSLAPSPVIGPVDNPQDFLSELAAKTETLGLDLKHGVNRLLMNVKDDWAALDEGPRHEHAVRPKRHDDTASSPSPYGSSHLSDKEMEETNERYRSCFGFGPEVSIVGSYFGTVKHHNDVLHGKIHISNQFLTFRRIGMGSPVRMAIPLDDIDNTKLNTKSGRGIVELSTTYTVIVSLGFPDEATAENFEHLLKETRKYRFEHRERTTRLGRLPTEEERAAVSIKHARLNIWEQAVNAQMDVKVPPVMFDPTSTELEEYFMARPEQPLRITMLTIGSRGDVQPYVALSLGLMKEGHRCKIATHSEFKDFVESYGIEFAEVAGNPNELMQIMIDHGSFSVAFIKDAAIKFRGWVGELLDSAWKACQDTDLLIESPSAMAGIHIAEALQIPYYRAFTMPWTRTRAYPHAFMVFDQNLGGSYNYMTYVMFDNLLWRGIAAKVNSWRKNVLHLPKTSLEEMQQQRVPFLYCVSPVVLVPPVDLPAWVHITGYWFLNENPNYKPPIGLAEFLEKAKQDGKKVVYVGFGSIIVSKPEEMTRAVVEGVEKADVRCVLAKGWSRRGETDKKHEAELPLPDSIFQVDSVAHQWLFPQIDAAVHHGGSGTTGASLRAGLPTIIKPFFGDQFFYAHRVEEMGCGIFLRKLTAETLGQSLREACTDAAMIQKADLVGEKIRHEHGVSNAIYDIYRELPYARSLIKDTENNQEPHKVFSTLNSLNPLKPSEDCGHTAFSRGKNVLSAALHPASLNPFRHASTHH